MGTEKTQQHDIAITSKANVERVDNPRDLEINIPEAVADELKKGVRAVMDRVIDPKTRPDLIIVLLRSGGLAYEAVEACMEENMVELPKSIGIYVSKQLAERVPSELFPDSLYKQDFSTDSRQAKEFKAYIKYREWLLKQAETRTILIQLRDHPPGSIQNRNPRLLILDDTESSGMTMLAGMIIVQEAFGSKAEIDTSLLVANEGEWKEAGIMDSNWPQLTKMFDEIGESREAESFYFASKRLLRALILGYDYGYDDEEGRVLYSINSNEDIQKMAQAYEEQYVLSGFLENFCRKFNIKLDQLDQIHSKTVVKIREIGENVKFKSKVLQD